MVDWPLSKSGMGQLIEGSNPSLSAKHKHFAKARCFCFAHAFHVYV